MIFKGPSGSEALSLWLYKNGFQTGFYVLCEFSGKLEAEVLNSRDPGLLLFYYTSSEGFICPGGRK